jgi:hypothetical protein
MMLMLAKLFAKIKTMTVLDWIIAVVVMLTLVALLWLMA